MILLNYRPEVKAMNRLWTHCWQSWEPAGEEQVAIEKPQLWRVSLEKGELRTLTPAKPGGPGGPGGPAGPGFPGVPGSPSLPRGPGAPLRGREEGSSEQVPSVGTIYLSGGSQVFRGPGEH